MLKSKINNRLMIPLLVLWGVCLVIKLVLRFLRLMDDMSLSCGINSLPGKNEILRSFLDFLRNLTYGDVILPSVILTVLILWFMGSVYDYRGQLSSTKCHRLIWGALLKTKCERCMIPASLASVLIAYVFWRLGYIFVSKILIVTLMTLFLWGAWFVTKTLNRIFSMRRQETYITWSQISLLAVFGLWIVVIVCCLNLQNNNPTDTAIITVFGAVLGWIFQDTIKSVAAFFYLRANGLLQIGDLIAVPAKGIEGFVRTISLTTVTVENWDTTTSAFPTFILHADHFKNSQRMLEGKTLGRLMKKTFIIDSGWVHPLTDNDIKRLRRALDVENFFVEKEVKCDKLNIEVFRLYIYHWLMNNPNVSQQPRLIVRWLEQTSEGLPLQLLVYLTDTMLDAFEWQQSQIMEHVIKAMGWFDLQLYQSPSGYDASNSNIYLTQQTADYRKKTDENARLK
ncbi:mechanosensitive ion channel domain-containing protein [Prevotella sp.]|uniref:mechanosensitive ion channel domain-containing protein n=1 Tax=Prevotella sp. TaxID=59823 RepID=UPI0040286E7B